MTQAHDRRVDLVEFVERWGLDGVWRQHAACAAAVKGGEIEVDDFYPPRGDHHMLARAAAVCARCPVTNECAQYADTHGERQGI